MSLPTVTSISPSSGPLSGGTSVTIVGNNFDTTPSATTVTIGGNAATGVSVTDANTLTCTTPAGSAGTASVVVTTGAGHNADNSLFTYGPTVTSVSPSRGPASGSTSVTITGTNFTGATAVTIGGVAATGITVVNATTITCTTPAGSAGPASVLVTAPYGTNAANTLYTYGPTITSILPASGLPGGGTPVTITGLGFAGASGVTIGGFAATGFSLSTDKTQITCTTPAGSLGSASVVVTATIGSNADNSLFTYAPAPTVGTISPDTGSSLGGISVTITGTDFNGATSVTIGGVEATNVSVVDNTTITCTTSPGIAGVFSVIVTTPSGMSGAGTVYTNVAPPTVTSISPPTGLPAGGAHVTITGTHFIGATGVTIGGAPATDVIVTDTVITCTIPVGSGAASVLVTTLGGTNAANTLFTYQPPPVVASLSPPIGASTGGSSVTITGANFIGANGVSIGGVAATGVTVVNATTITCTTPAGGAGTASVLVTTAAGTNAANTLFLYVVAAPTDTYIYLKGGRGDGFVPLWTGTLAEEGMVSDTGAAEGTAGREVSEPYRDIHNYSTTVKAAVQTPYNYTINAGELVLSGTALKPTGATPALFTGITLNGLPPAGIFSSATGFGISAVPTSTGAGSMALTGLTPQVSDEVAHEKPRQYARVSTWLIFISQNGLPYKFRKDSVLGWGSKPRSE